MIIIIMVKGTVKMLMEGRSGGGGTREYLD